MVIITGIHNAESNDYEVEATENGTLLHASTTTDAWVGLTKVFTLRDLYPGATVLLGNDAIAARTSR